ncbi:cache domain-containing protein [Paenibacillus sp. IB182496]|uniref:Cache domain-containing protein n=1 Tax=Paenibacillus sabuli TaxID=2772509 RepID=A0A927BQW0_9BACL|nr:methyl-accepting chemotaxis protein [Paenibacillus sabuli]MBD2845083.1 cache domain-containing protein [Paenibacillus sabuli]
MLKLPIRVKLLLVCFLLLIIPLVSLGIVTYEVADHESTELVKDSLRNNVRLAGTTLYALDEMVQNGSMPLEEAQETLRVKLLGERGEDGTRPITDRFDMGEHGYFFVLDAQGVLLGHPTREGDSLWDEQSKGDYYIRNMVEAAQQGGGFVNYDFALPGTDELATKVTYAELYPEWGWIIAAGSYLQDFKGGQRNILEAMLLTLGICLAVGIVGLLLFAFHISRPVMRMAQRAERIAEGDLTGEPIKVKNRDETGKLAQSFNHLIDNLRELAGNQTLSANALAAAAGNLNHTIVETKEAVNQTSASISEVAGNNQTQATSLEETSRAMEEMAGGIQRIATTSSAAFESSTVTLQEAENGNTLIQRSSGQMTAVSETVGTLSGVVRQLGERSQQIGDIAGAISDISKQTNLLALNASIEAARAGEHGKGFAVVAEEIRKLAVRAGTSSGQVAELIESIRGDIEDTVQSMHQGEREVAEGVSSIRETGEAFARILEATRSVVGQVEEASAAAEQMSASAEQISASLQEMERLSSGTAGAAQAVASAAGEQRAAMENITDSANSLTGMSDNMRELATRFKL